jgi:amino acid adenylation domain-containing protein
LKAASGPDREPIPLRTGTDPSPLSFAQEGLWLFDQSEPQNPVYNVAQAVEWKGPLDRDALRKALKEVVSRHESLRTVIRSVDGAPMQVVTLADAFRLETVDLRHHASGEEVQQWMKEEARRPFDLSQDLMLRATLLEIGQEDYWLLLVIHHIAFDDWSMRVLLRELEILYEAFSEGKPAGLPELRIQYKDFSSWRRQWLEGPVLEHRLAYWREHLAGAPPLLQLGTDRSRPSRPTYTGAREAVALPESLTEPLMALGKQEQTTLFLTLLAAFQALLHRYSGQADFCVGLPASIRSRVETQGLIGMFLDTLVLRADLSGDPSFRELLRRVEARVQEADQHEVPLEKLVEALQPERSLSYSPLFQAMFIFQESPPGKLSLTGVSTRTVEIDTRTAKFDLTLSLEESSGRIAGWLEYSTDLFEAETIRRMAAHYEALAAAAVRDPNQPVAALQLLSETERRQILLEWNDTRSAYPQCCVHQLIEMQARRSPDSIAVADDHRQMTYRELNARSNQVARYLRNLGVGPDTLVGIAVERSIEIVVALLGILKSGGAYVPLDVEYPTERLAFMVKDAGLRVLLSQKQFQPRLPSVQQVLYLDSHSEEISQQSGEDFPSSSGPDNLAYVTYTSGSTGVPKGVEIPHRALVNFLTAMQLRPGITADDTILAVTRLTFDIAGLELFLPLAVGGRVVVASREAAADGARLRERLASSGATIFQATPSTFRILLGSGWQGGRNIRILCGGEPLPSELARELLRRASSLWNMYGPTETTVWSTVYQIRSADEPISIGTPIGNTQCHVLDARLGPVPVGVTGELYIGGDGLAVSYRNRAELTAERFVPNPFTSKPGERLYRTGDLARYLPDGNIECMGRVDYQVKIRGFRVELGEIESILVQHPGVRAAAVLAREDTPGDKRLVAYVVPEARTLDTMVPASAWQSEQVASAQSIPEIRAFLQQKLPDYMVPAGFVFLDALPLTPNGKVDRKALPAPLDLRPEAGTRFIAPRTEMEEKLAQIWCEVLRLDRVGIHDNFFELGGNSLLAVRVVGKVIQTFANENFTLSAMLQAPTVSEFARLLMQGGSQYRLLVPMRTAGTRPPFYCVHGAGGNVVSLRTLAMGMPEGQPFYCLQSRGLDGGEPFRTTEEAAANYVQEIRRLQPHGPYYIGGLSYGGLVAFEMARELVRLGEEVGLVALLDAHNPAYLARLPKRKLLDLNARFFCMRGVYHLQRLKELSPKQRFLYFRERGHALAHHFSALIAVLFGNSKTPREAIAGVLDAYGYGPHANGIIHADEVHDAFGQTLYRVAQAYLNAERLFVPKPYSGRVTIFRASQSSDHRHLDPYLGWGPVALGGVEICEVPGAHGDIAMEPNVSILAAKLDERLRKAQNRQWREW